jgi:Adenylate and Guanylate cyclase catalytic domain/HAMP domain
MSQAHFWDWPEAAPSNFLSMPVFNRLNLSIQSKLMVMLLLVAVTSIGVISWISYSSARTALTEAAFNQLTSVRASKKIQIEAFFKTVRFQVSNLANDRMIVGATREFTDGFAKFQTAKLDPEQDRKIRAFYHDEFLPKLAAGTGQTPRMEVFFPESPAARYAQFLYIANNPDPGKRFKLWDAGDGSEFSKSHARYQPIVTKFVLDFGYDNFILVDYRTGNVVYTFTKSPLFGTNLINGPYSQTSAATLYHAIRRAGTQHKVRVVDFAPMPSALGKPVALMGAPVFEGSDPIGMLFIQFPVDEINRVMTDNFGWVQDGLGKTGEVYLVGPDMLMRSRSRLLHEDPKQYFQELENADYAPEDIERVRRAGTATLAQAARTEAVLQALSGKTGTAILPNYLHAVTLSSFAPLSLPGLNWVIVAEMQASEAFAPLISLTRQIVIWSLVTVLGVTVLAAVFGRRFVRPIFRLIEGVHRLKAGARDFSIAIGSRDEFEDLGTGFNRITQKITSLGDRLERVTRERDSLIDNILPAPAASRMKAGQPSAMDEYPEVSIAFASFFSRDESGLAKGVDSSLGLLNDLTIAIDDAAERRGVHKLSSDAATYVAACGLSRQRLDDASRTIDFAQDILRVVQRLHRDRQTDLWVKIGIDSGSAAGGVAGRKRFSYQLAGEPMVMAGMLSAHAPRDTILASRLVYSSTQSLYRYGPPIQITPPGGGSIATWPLTVADNRETKAPPVGGPPPIAGTGRATEAATPVSSESAPEIKRDDRIPEGDGGQVVGTGAPDRGPIRRGAEGPQGSGLDR